MFQEYVDLVTQAVQNSEKKISEYGKKREAMALEIKSKIESESESITKSTELKNYSPIQHHNEMTELIHAFEKIREDELKEFESIKLTLHDNLVKIMKLPEPKPADPIVKEMYKIISSSNQNPTHICRVWFTLVDQRKPYNLKPGDPIRIEWVNVTNGIQRPIDNQNTITAVSQRHAAGPEGIKIPQFASAAVITGTNSFYPITQWGASSSQRTWWETWLAQNKPI